ncbi:iron-containing alcohol dehydrogenase [Pelagicoccus albus]|uniref:Iron-containing alcohol dehydrogenase n=1 Tax=Pelagicoccus albus TaxID=415222 RepID=A0A7X1B9I3_9BACT|nr:iron-containing alcohol dehydrogenase [Pelagicoccus albus]MBC2608042.1 iron-containing alcohol dehydrogenase [Pelagicoccus albus]
MLDSTKTKQAQDLRPITLLQPAKIAFGAGCSLQAADDLKNRGLKSVAIFASEPTRFLTDSLIAKLEEEQFTIHVHAGKAAEPTFQDAVEAAAWLEQTGAQAVIGFGGGSVIDVAKIASATAHQDAPLDNYVGNGLLPKRTLPLFAIPTTAGAGSEASPNAIFLDTEAQLKKGVISPWLMPDAAYVDPELTYSLPASITAATALDALSHCVEAYANRNAHPLVDVYALKGTELIFNNLAAALENSRDTQARSALALGSLYGGLCLGPVNTAAIHALSYPLGSEYHVPHGLSNAVLMPHVLRFNAATSPERYAQLAQSLGLGDPNATTENLAERFIKAIEQLCVDCSITSTLSDFGVSQSDVPRMAASAITIQRLLVNNLRELSQADAEGIYQNAF